LHPSLSVLCPSFESPKFMMAFMWKCFFSRNTTVLDVVECVLDSLGLTKSLPVPGGGIVDYILEKFGTKAMPRVSCMMLSTLYQLISVFHRL